MNSPNSPFIQLCNGFTYCLEASALFFLVSVLLTRKERMAMHFWAVLGYLG